MGYFRRLKSLWELSKELEDPKKEKPLRFRRERAVFITPNRAEELIKSGKEISIDDVLI